MKKFKQKEYTIQEGRYTGPKDLEKIPGALEVIGKTTFGGALTGGVIGGVLDKTGIVENSSITKGASIGGKTGFVAGILSKVLLNALHKPMKTVKFQEVDKLLRTKFGMYRLSGFNVGDSLQNRQSMEERFAYNSRKVTDFKISFCIQDNKVTMYTLNITDNDLEMLNSSLDYYCKKYSGMSYTSKPINIKTNSYSVTITFTNYSAISDFISEVSERLNYRINLLNNNLLLEREISDGTYSPEEPDEEEKQFSVPVFEKQDIFNTVFKKAIKSIGAFAMGGFKTGLSAFAMGTVLEGLNKYNTTQLSKIGPVRSKDLNNPFLEDRLKRLNFVEGVHYTVGEKDKECNIRVEQGLFIVTYPKNTKTESLLDNILPEGDKKELGKKVIVWADRIDNRDKFDILLKKIIITGIKPNIFVDDQI